MLTIEEKKGFSCFNVVKFNVILTKKEGRRSEKEGLVWIRKRFLA
jgi:hypothetical protein